jgi:hypothetical protein
MFASLVRWSLVSHHHYSILGGPVITSCLQFPFDASITNLRSSGQPTTSGGSAYTSCSTAYDAKAKLIASNPEKEMAPSNR